MEYSKCLNTMVTNNRNPLNNVLGESYLGRRRNEADPVIGDLVRGEGVIVETKESVDKKPRIPSG